MKRVVILFPLFLFLFSCGGNNKSYRPGSDSDQGELVGVYNEKYKSGGIPFGMVLIPPGSFIMGTNSYDISANVESRSKTVSMSAFFMDEAEITNNKYRQFVYWVTDYNVRLALAKKVEELLEAGAQKPNEESEASNIFQFSFKPIDTSLAYNKFMMGKYGTINPNSLTGGREINWDIPLIYDVELYPDLEYTEILEDFYTPIQERIKGIRNFDVKKIVYKYFKKISSSSSPEVSKLSEIDVKIYPDTTVWLKDFSYSYNEPMHNDYFYHMAFIDYPVVGVNWVQADAFCNWRTEYKNTFNKKNSIPNVRDYRLPSEFEWEYSARGGIEGSMYSWGGPYAVDDRGCVLANFKPLRGDYVADGYLYTVEAKSFAPNSYGLYNMSGNVSEWTSTSYREDIYSFISSINPNYVNEDINEKVIRGGSWKDIVYFLQVFVRDYEYKDTSRSYIGFRSVQDFQGSEANLL